MLELFSQLRSIDICKLPHDAAIDALGRLIDLSDDLKRGDGIKQALGWCTKIDTLNLSPANRCLLDYYRANCWDSLQKEKRLDRSVVWSWEQPEIEKQIFYLRRATISDGFLPLDIMRKCQIWTNLGNSFNSIGRFIDALETWGKAIQAVPAFGMSLGNRGWGLISYAKALYDESEAPPFIGFAHLDLSNALAPSALYCEDARLAKTFFTDCLQWIESLFELKQDIINGRTLIAYELGVTEKEKKYRQWCLDNVLFLNPLNDIQAHSAAAVDSLVLPPLIASIEEQYPPSIIGFFSQIKQEFVTARWMYYVGASQKLLHFSDKDVTLTNTLDFPSYSYATEHIKTAYRISYSILDKIAFLLNCYFKLGIKENQVSFRSLWYDTECGQNKTIRELFEKSENWPLRGLFWLSKDIYEDKFQNVLDPQAREINRIRNHLEHKYLQVHQMSISGPARKDKGNSLGYHVSIDALRSKALRLLKLSRSALIYLSLGLHSEEKKRKKALGEKLIMPIELYTFDDEWKSPLFT